MDLDSAYRWNVPTLTYGFDQSFLDFFGSNGVAAVETAIQMINDVPPASEVVLTNYSTRAAAANWTAEFEGLFDLKSQTLCLLLEHLGLASPTRYVYALRQWEPFLSLRDWQFSTVWDVLIPYYIVQRNFDPESLQQSIGVNGVLYAGALYIADGDNLIYQYPVDPTEPYYTAVADAVAPYDSLPGVFYSRLTFDDVGGLRYLLSTNTLRYETLVPGVQSNQTNANPLVNGAWRPGVDKITFVAHPFDSLTGHFVAITNQFTDNYVTNGNLAQQQVQRVIAEPDFLFCAGDVSADTRYVQLYSRTGTSNWINNASSNANQTGAGPGVIQPQVRITFQKLGMYLYRDGSDEWATAYPILWGSFDSTNTVAYPVPQSGTNRTTMHMWLLLGSGNNALTQRFDWSPKGPTGAQFAFQTSTNLSDWVLLFTLTNNGSICTYVNDHPSSTQRFYRLLPE
jgi:hypothetical protein